MAPPLRNVPYFPVGSPVVYEALGYQFLPGVLKPWSAYTQYLRDRPVGIIVPALPVSYHYQKQIQNHGFMA
jgi:hypothetical protein